MRASPLTPPPCPPGPVAVQDERRGRQRGVLPAAAAPAAVRRRARRRRGRGRGRGRPRPLHLRGPGRRRGLRVGPREEGLVPQGAAGRAGTARAGGGEGTERARRGGGSAWLVCPALPTTSCHPFLRFCASKCSVREVQVGNARLAVFPSSILNRKGETDAASHQLHVVIQPDDLQVNTRVTIQQ